MAAARGAEGVELSALEPPASPVTPARAKLQGISSFGARGLDAVKDGLGSAWKGLKEAAAEGARL